EPELTARGSASGLLPRGLGLPDPPRRRARAQQPVRDGPAGISPGAVPFPRPRQLGGLDTGRNSDGRPADVRGAVMTPASSPRFSGVSSDRPDAGDGRFRGAPLARPRVRIAEPDRFSLAARRVLVGVA